MWDLGLRRGGGNARVGQTIPAGPSVALTTRGTPFRSLRTYEAMKIEEMVEAVEQATELLKILQLMRCGWCSAGDSTLRCTTRVRIRGEIDE